MIEILIQPLEFQICATTLPSSPKFLQKNADFKSAISPSSELQFDWCFFEIGYFFTKNPDMQLDFIDLLLRCPDLRHNFAAPKNCLQPDPSHSRIPPAAKFVPQISLHHSDISRVRTTHGHIRLRASADHRWDWRMGCAEHLIHRRVCGMLIKQGGHRTI